MFTRITNIVSHSFEETRIFVCNLLQNKTKKPQEIKSWINFLSPKTDASRTN